MGIKAKVSRGCILKGSLVLGMGLCSVLLYRFLPSLFGYLVSSSPIIFCTAILLGTLLSFGQANIPRAEEENRNTVTSATARHADNDLVAETAASVNEKATQEASLRKRNKKVLIGDNEKGINDEKKMVEVENRDIHDDGQCHLGSDADSSSPDASVTDVMPVLDELHPLIYPEAPGANLTPCDESDAQESDDGSVDLAGDIENAEEEEAQERDIVTWTADDEKNLKDLGTLEIARNQRLENLIAKRRARKRWMVEAEKNLIDLDGNDGMQISIPARRNPFDPLYDLDEIPVPGSAPSVLLPRLNPFDLPFEQADDNKVSPAGENSNHQEFTTFQPRDVFFRRYESFTVGPSFLGEMRQDRNDFKLRPYFMVEGMPYDTTLQRQFSEKSDSKVSSVPETDTVSSIADREDNAKELLEQESHQVGDLNSLTNQASERTEGASEFSEDTDSVLESNLSDTIEETSQDVHNGRLREPSYDWSPSATERGSLHDDRGSVSDSENERMEIESDDKGLWMAPQRLCEVEENESKSSRGVRIVCERDVIQVGMRPETGHEQVSQSASFSSPAPNSGEEGVMDEKVIHQLKVAHLPSGSSQQIHNVGPQIDMAENANAEGNHNESQDLPSPQSRYTEKTNENLKSELEIGS